MTNNCKKLKYVGYTIAFQEVPNEVSLVFNISGCPHSCEGCHSKFLQQYVGNYLIDDIKDIIESYKGCITCVCFMGGDQNIKELRELTDICDDYGLKTCLYSGSDSCVLFDEQVFDYIKLGRYVEELGGLDNQTTNQRMWELSNGKYENITWKFWDKKH